LANVLDFLHADRIGSNLYLYGVATAAGVDTLWLHYKVPRGMTVRVVSIVGWQDSGATKSGTFNIARPEHYGKTSTAGIKAPANWIVLVQDLTTSTNTSYDLSNWKGPADFTEDNVLDFRCSSAAGKSFKIYCVLKILQEAEV